MTTPLLREATHDDLRFVHASWFDSWWKLRARKNIEFEIYKKEMNPRIDRLIERSRVLVAFFPEVPDEILGWSCIERDALHFCVVKHEYRRSGIGRGLVFGNASYYTHMTDDVGQRFARKMSLKYNVFLIESR